jgi:hypothetical protein
MTTPTTPNLAAEKPSFSETATKLESLNNALAANVDRYAALLAGRDPLAVIRDQNLQIEYLARQINTATAETLRIQDLADQLELHRESVTEMARNLRILPRWCWIRRNRIHRQLAQIAISIERNTTRKA